MLFVIDIGFINSCGCCSYSKKKPKTPKILH